MASFPNLPGVPVLSPSNPTESLPFPNSAAFSSVQSGDNRIDSLNPVWGIYDATGTDLVLEPDTFLGIEFVNEMNISTYPIENGQFASFNKVRTPYKVVVKVAKGSAASVNKNISVTDRDDFLSAIDDLLASLDLCTIVTPEASYQNANLEHYDYRREIKNGTGIIIASLRFVEIMPASSFMSAATGTAVAPDPTATKNPSSTAPVQSGAVQAQPYGVDQLLQPFQPV